MKQKAKSIISLSLSGEKHDKDESTQITLE